MSSSTERQNIHASGFHTQEVVVGPCESESESEEDYKVLYEEQVNLVNQILGMWRKTEDELNKLKKNKKKPPPTPPTPPPTPTPPTPPSSTLVMSASYTEGTRISLERVWNVLLPIMYIIMYRPSTADAKKNDTTIERTISIAKFNKYGSIKVYNLIPGFVPDLPTKELVIAWGGKEKVKESKKQIKLLNSKYNLKCFTILKNGNPGLPTRLKNSTTLLEYV